MCQYGVNVVTRIEEYQFLDFPYDIEVRTGIGLFHIHGHQEKCFARFSPSFVRGMGQVDGEIVETLWAPLNHIARSTEGMALSHRQETLDDHMNDSNWKKLVGAVPSLGKRYAAAVKGRESSNEDYRRFCEGSSTAQLEKWKSIEVKAQKTRSANPAAMDVYDIQVLKAPGRAAIQQDLVENEVKDGLIRGTTSWISQGVKLQEQQLALATHVRKLGNKISSDDANKLEDRRKVLQGRIDTYEKQAPEYMRGSLDVADDSVVVQNNDANDPQWDDMDDVALQPAPLVAPSTAVPPERLSLTLPSTVGPRLREGRTYTTLRSCEIKLREGQMNDHLHELRLALAQKSCVYRLHVRHSKSQATVTRAWNKVSAVDHVIQQHARVYGVARKALVTLNAPEELLKTYQELRQDQLQAQTYVIDPRIIGQRNLSLPWFWHLNVGKTGTASQYMTDCIY
ncbi:hypothetical protein DENSPDRAFT_854906 [Dentipellis sp. KUC8613]|nr:hypothetical protein DENSPDRAFT_854906 [Dentipellis sp. KUC8613]